MGRLMLPKITPVILAGGAGERLWPLSRAMYPKQFISILGDKRSLFQHCLDRVVDAEQFNPPIIIGSEDHRFVIAEQLRQSGIKAESIILEPMRRNTAPAIALGALVALKSDPNALILVKPADHLIRDNQAFLKAVKLGVVAAEQGKLVTFGITPDSPHTGYGYIKHGNKLSDAEGVFSVAKFVEKPDAQTAANYLKEGGYTWNAGIFLFKARDYLIALEQLAPEVAAACKRAVDKMVSDEDFARPDKSAFESSPSDSIDYAVMEKTDKAAITPVDMGWHDLGSWNALCEISPKDADNNALIGPASVYDCKNSLIKSDKYLIAGVGLDNIAVIAADDAILVADRSRLEDVKKLVGKLKAEKLKHVDEHSFSNRPWGSFWSMDKGDRYQVKRLTVKPGGKISLQKHSKRSEHWIVVSGIATVTNGDKVFDLNENESTYIPVGTVHRLENRQKIDLNIIEVQTGGYLGEDDIERFDDIYGRADSEPPLKKQA
jgi:mannose-1-phosphate guanylyltransferase/mannose-6-phosphate isomerase